MWHIYISIAVLFRGAFCHPVIKTAEHSNCKVIIKHAGKQVSTLDVKWNSTINLICDASCVGPSQQLGLIWFYRDKNKQKLINIEKLFRSPKFETYPTNSHRKNELVIRDFGPNEETDFICRGSIKQRRHEAKVALIGMGPPTIVIQPSKTINAIVGQRVRMECKAQGDPILNVYWINPFGDIVPPSSFPRKEGTAILDITNVGKENTGYYTCVAQNVGGRTEDRVQLFVEEGQRAEVKIAGSGTLSVVDGGSMELTCTAAAILNPLIQWRRREGPLSPGHSLNGGTMSFLQLTVEYGGEYICSTSSPEGSYQASVFITVTGNTMNTTATVTTIRMPEKGVVIEKTSDESDYIDMTTTASTLLMPETDVETKQTSRKTCPVNTFQCRQTNILECIDNNLHCDGTPDCTDGSDEKGCTKSCEFQCRNGTCISATKKCDGIPDCPDDDDEICELLLFCPDGKKGCKDYSKCIDNSQLCDGVHDCTDGGDEKDCGTEKRRQ